MPLSGVQSCNLLNRADKSGGIGEVGPQFLGLGVALEGQGRMEIQLQPTSGTQKPGPRDPSIVRKPRPTAAIIQVAATAQPIDRRLGRADD